MRTSHIVIATVLVLGFWFLLSPFNTYYSFKKVEPRVVTARGNLADDELNTIDIFKSNSPSVVYITSIALKRDFFSLNAVEIPQGTGSGFIWDAAGHIVTNYHVISDASRIQVTMADGSTWKAVLTGVAPDKDLAVLQINPTSRMLIPIAVGSSSDLLVGQKVFAIGNPFGLDQTITSGIISALGREINAMSGRIIHGMVQTDAAINPGNSGGPLLDSAGRLIGVNTAIFSPSGTYAGIGFAVPVDTVNQVVPQIIQHGRIVKPGIGATLADERLARRLGIEGVLIINIEQNSPAEKAGLQPTAQYKGQIILGDIITEVENVKVFSYDDLRREIERHSINSEIKLTILRAGEYYYVPVKLTALN